MTTTGETPKRRCPHGNVVHCPLYLASHGVGVSGGAGGCCSGDWSEGCAVDRGEVEYRALVALVDPQVVGECLTREAEAERRAQRRRNMLQAGVR